MNIVCVLKTGGDYTPKHVARLLGQFAAHAPIGEDFACLTDHPDLLGVDFRRPLEHDWPGSPERLARFDVWPGWWAKLEAYRLPARRSTSTWTSTSSATCRRSATSCARFPRETLLMCRGFLGRRGPEPGQQQSWSAGPATRASSTRSSRGGRTPSCAPTSCATAVGRPGVRARALAWPIRLGGRLPGVVLSFKRDVLRGADLSRAVIIASHGKPRPWEAEGADARLISSWACRPVRTFTLCTFYGQRCGLVPKAGSWAGFMGSAQSPLPVTSRATCRGATGARSGSFDALDVAKEDGLSKPSSSVTCAGATRLQGDRAAPIG